MANNYTRFTVRPINLPFSDGEVGVLRKLYNLNYQHNEDGTYYLYSEDGQEVFILNEIEWEYTPFEQLIYKKNWDLYHSLLFLRGKYNLPFIQILGSYYCDRMRPGEFGGFEILITVNGIKYMYTGQLLQKYKRKYNDA
jgi:hypothetical protein